MSPFALFPPAALPSPAAAIQAVWSFFERGGLFMLPLALCSIIGMMAILYKFLSLSRNRVIPPGLSRDVEAFERRIHDGDSEPVLRRFQGGQSTLARLCSVALKHRGKSLTEITQSVESAAREEAVHLHSGIGVLDVVITVSPLLGLLGTASGLVVIFEGLGETTDHVAIARGIAVALNTTIFGLAIAVPCVIAHSYFIRRIEMLTARLEGLMGDLVHVLNNKESRSASADPAAPPVLPAADH
ncbi:MAG: MotA/TolQ/ExbB proton channel family protein [Akkermansiaceae bacterium]|nr:MotA/TolQ/ExbB proton channel family protein [Akkermansiaceae bacterium]MCF7734501.1 MotA/TolQ/ExbB proton channel family protein [Akkermansiaceae bacterium]